MSKAIFTTRTGCEFDLINPKLDSINIDDIAWALSQTCRFNGHVPYFYSVADHSIRVSEMVDEKYRLTALLHDAAEAYTGDCISPLKAVLPGFKVIENNIEQFIAVKFGLIYPFPPEVHHADKQMFELEQKWRKDEYNLKPLNASSSYMHFILRYNELIHKRKMLEGILK